MQWISISDSSLIIGICEQKSNLNTITRILKKPFINTGDSVFFLEELQTSLNEILLSIDKSTIVDNKIAISIPGCRAHFFENKIDMGLSEQEENDILSWKMKKYLSSDDNFFIQHYPSQDLKDEKTFLSIAINEKLKSTIIDVLVTNGFEPEFMDIGIFSAYNLLLKSFPLTSYNRWGIWKIAEHEKAQGLLIYENEKISFLSFKINNENEAPTILNNTNPQLFNEQFLEQFLLKDYTSIDIDKMFVYSQNPVNTFVQKHLNNIKNLVINPLPILSTQKVQIEKKYLRDKFLLSQFIEIAGLISRY